MEENPFLNADIDPQTVMGEPVAQEQQTAHETAIPLWSWIKFAMVGFALMVFYIYNSHHANKAIRKKEELTKELKELHSERISSESQITNASKQSELSKRLEGSGLKEITTPPIKLVKPHEQD
ncbi:MAG: FtsL-like putative cell division protein [Bacteroidetes bacterium]|nr:FtsL-like putative cell division protein [Bacteroidota bacterium]MDA1225042.1 FtsL-like putative cell division protein [Bacteroidota bacterium]